MFLVCLVSHILSNEKCKCVQWVFIHEGTFRINGCSMGGPCCRGWLLLSALLCVVLQLISRSAVHTKMPNISITRQRLKRQAGGRRGGKHPAAARSAAVLLPFGVRQKLPPPKRSLVVWSSHVTFNNSQISLHKQLWRCDTPPNTLWRSGRPEEPN